MPKVTVVMGSQSDMPVVGKTIDKLKEFGVKVVPMVCSAHRTPEIAAEFAKNARANEVDVIIAAAGKAAHLPGVLAAFTTLPIIGLPIKSSFMDGLDSLLSIAQMPSGVPVATVGVNAAENAAILAVQIMSLKYSDLGKKLKIMKEKMAEKVILCDKAVREEINL